MQKELNFIEQVLTRSRQIEGKSHSDKTNDHGNQQKIIARRMEQGTKISVTQH